LVLTQVAVAGGDEVAAFALALAALPELADVLVTADALHCVRGDADFLATRGGRYLFTVKGNQPLLRQELMGLPWGAGSRHPSPRDQTWPDGVPLDQGYRPGRHRRSGAVPRRPPGDQGRPPATRRRT